MMRRGRRQHRKVEEAMGKGGMRRRGGKKVKTEEKGVGGGE